MKGERRLKTLKSDFMDILDSQRIKPVFQPIVCLKTGEIIGYEALSRIVEPKEIQSSEELFHLAGIYGKVWELEQLCRGKILEKYHSFQGTDNKKLFINVNPMVIHDKEFRSGFTSEYLKQYDLDLGNIVFEVTERNVVDDVKGFKDTIRHYKLQGYNIAVDDAGSCYSGLNLICDIVPHYLKLDIMLIHDIHKDAIKYAMVKAMVEFANSADVQLVAEGIECEEELKILLKLGVHNGQGYFLRKPNEDLKGVNKSALDIIHEYRRKNGKMHKNDEMHRLQVVLFKFESYKAYNAFCEKYGDEKGNMFLQAMQKIIEQNLSDKEAAFVIRDDSIVTILEKRNYELKCEMISNMFRNKTQEYYQNEDIEKGYIEKKNKHGEKKKYPFVSISFECLI